MLEPILTRFGDYLRGVRLSPPQLPLISNRTGQPLTDAQATDPAYWVAHLRNTVDFRACMATLTATPDRLYVEMGPGRAMSSLAQANGVAAAQVIAALRHPEQKMADDAWHMAAVARAWACGVPVDWDPIWDAPRHKVPLPGYAFQRKTYFIEPGKTVLVEPAAMPARVPDLANWGWQPQWRPAETGVDLAADLAEGPRQSWLIFADDTGLAAAAAARLRDAGHHVTMVRTGDAFARDGAGGYLLAPERGREGYDALIRDLVAQGHAPARIAHFWLVTRGETFRPGSSFLHRTLEQGFYSLLFLAQAMAEENLPRPLHVQVFTSGAAIHPEKATALGPVQVIPRELPGVTAAILDLTLPDAPKRGKVALGPLADRVLEELLAPPKNLQAALRDGRRWELGLKAAPLPEPGDLPLAKGAHVVITGGFGGIGLTVAEDLIRRVGAKITLIARSPLPPRADWLRITARAAPHDGVVRRIQALQRLEALGGEVLVAAADVCNEEDMRAALARGVQRFGKVSALIHAAGVVDDGPLLVKTPAAAEEVFAPKLHGTLVLDRLFPDGSLDLLVLFSSTSTVTAPAGQVDYVAANAFLNAYAGSRRGGKTRVLALNWGIWNGVGMAAEALADRHGREMPAPVAITAPLLDAAGFDAQGNRQFTARYGIDRWVLDGHRTAKGQALIPGTGTLEIVAEAVRAQGETGPFALHDLYFFRPLDVADGAQSEVRALLTRTDEGYGFELRSAVQHQGRTGWQLHAQARVVPLTDAPRPRLDIAAIAARLPAPETGLGLTSPQEAHLRFGPRWRVIRSRALGATEGLARLALPDQYRGEPDQGWLLHPALMDLATGWAMGLIAGYEPSHLWVPVSYASVRVLRPLPAEVYSHVRNAGVNRAEGPTAVFDITIADAAGEVCVEIAGFSIRRLEGGLSFARPEARDLSFDADPRARAGSPAEERLLHSFAQGIRPEEGAEAFGRALLLPKGQAQVVISSLDLPALVRQAAVVEQRAEGQSFARPDLDTDYVAPRTDVERTLTGFWQDLLGVAQVGVEDSFFDLGGHSLIAVRLFAMVKKAYRVDFPISVLFEAPTIARCAALIAAEIGEVVDAPTAPVRRFTHLVPMHQGEGGAKAPFFLVAGMFGNVLNLRHLAQLLGGDRPFYGLQARGLYGDAPPHETLAEAATDYIAELRQVQAHGPYLLGGFSGGGLTAWEMARQLEAAGEAVALLVLLDTPLPMRPGLSRRDKALLKGAEVRAKGPGFFLEWARRRLAWEMQKRRGDAPLADTPAQFHNAAIETAFRAALPGFQMQPRQGRTVLVRPPLDRAYKVSGGNWISRAREYVFADNDLTRFAPALEVIEVPGDHDSMVLEPNVRVMAARLKAVIAGAETRPALLPLAQAAE